MSSIVYPYLPEGKMILYVKGDDPFMKEAKRTCKEDSTDFYHPTGSVLVKDGKVIHGAGNKSKISNPKLIEFHRTKFCVRRMLKIPTGKKYWLCYGCASCQYHSESRVVKTAKKKGIDTRGADLYLWGHWWCCEPCWKNMIDGGIRNVYLLEGSEILFNRSLPQNIIGKFSN